MRNHCFIGMTSCLTRWTVFQLLLKRFGQQRQQHNKKINFCGLLAACMGLLFSEHKLIVINTFGRALHL